jgi:TonB family protein
MAKPLSSDQSGPVIEQEPSQPKSVQFAHFGVLNDGAQSKTSTLTAVAINVLLGFVIVIIGAATKKTMDNSRKLTELTEPIPIKKLDEVKPKVVPPKPPPPKLPEVPKIQVQTPRIVVPDVKLPDVPKPVVVKMAEPKPVLMPAAPKIVVAQAAPKPVDLAHPSPPALANNSAHPSAVALGRPDNPVAPTTATGPAKIDLGTRGVSGMPGSNTGAGRPTAVNLAGSGSPGGSNKGTGVQAVPGLKGGVIGGTGPLNSTGRVAGPVNLAQAAPPPVARPAGPTASTQSSGPKVISKPKPEYTAEAIQLHLEGTVSVSIRVTATGAVQILGVTSGLGHGLDESAKRAVLATRFQPALDASGSPVAWEGVVKVAFQLAG